MLEAEQNNPEISAAERGYKAATHVGPQVSAPPETQVTTQLFSGEARFLLQGTRIVILLISVWA
jgi:hypothetical protein